MEAAVDGAWCSTVLGHVYDETFAGASREKIAALQTSRNTGVAMTAAWQLLKDAAAAQPAGEGLAREIAPPAIQRFLGFTEGRLRVTLPQWWERSLAKGQWAHGSGVLPRDIEALREKLLWNTKALIHAPRSASVERVDAGLHIRMKSGELLEVPKPVLAEVENEYFDSDFEGDENDSVDFAVVNGERFLVAFYENDPGESYPLYCLDRKSGRVLWKAKVWEGVTGIGSTGPHWFTHVAGIRLAGDAVYVFGLTSVSAYVNGFSLSDGRNRFHFNTFHLDLHYKKG